MSIMDKPKLVNVKADETTEKLSMCAVRQVMHDLAEAGVEWPPGRVLVIVWRDGDGCWAIMSAGALDAMREEGGIPEETFKRVTSPTSDDERWMHLILSHSDQLWFRTALVRHNRPGESFGWNPTVGQA